MKNDSAAEKHRMKKGVIIFAPILVAFLALLLFRVIYDIKTYCFGSTVVFYKPEYRDYDFLLHLPPGYHDFYGRRPLLVYLHGAGEVGKDVKILDDYAPYKYLNNTKEEVDFPFIVVCPMSEKGGWNSSRVVHLVEQVLHETRYRFDIDPDRVYLTGFSMGGFGTFQIACDYPGQFAAILPLAGGGDPEEAEKLRSVPTWAFHGDADGVVDFESSAKMIAAMTPYNAEAKLTTLYGADHGIQDLVYSKRDVYRWLLEHKRNEYEVLHEK